MISMIIMLMLMIVLMIMIMLMLVIMLMIMLVVLLETPVSPVSLWTPRAPGQIGRYLRLSVGLVLRGIFFNLGENLACSTKGVYSTDVFQMGFF
jgi:hypothetical protein